MTNIPISNINFNYIGGSMQKKILLPEDKMDILNNSKLYHKLGIMIKLIESDLTDEIDKSSPMKVNLSFKALDAFVDAFNDQGEDTIFFKMLMNLSPLNYFKFLNDISNPNYMGSSSDIADKYLTSEKMLRKLNRFYNEYDKVYDYCQVHNYTSLYLFELNDSTTKWFKNLSKYLHDEDKDIRQLVSSIFNEFDNETSKCIINGKSVTELYNKTKAIDENIDTLFKMVDVSYLYSINYLHSMLKF